jgi:ubiquinone/menaquinone biosynthesis C-methylase UbiE
MSLTRTELKRKLLKLNKELDYTSAPKKKKHIKGKRLSPYQVKKMSYRNIENIEEFPNDTYLNCAKRDLKDYFKAFGRKKDKMSLETFLLDKLEEARKNKSTLGVLDCGAGEGNMLRDLLLMDKDGVKIECTGISMHYFDDTEELLKKHRNLTWFNHKAEDALPKFKSESVDIITDFYGAYFYSPERVDILNHYHRLLKPGGRAFIHNSRHTLNLVQFKHNQAQCIKDFETHLVKNHPETFQWGDAKETFLVIQKTTMRSPLLSFKVKEIEEACWGHAELWKKELNLSEEGLRDGQGYYPQRITIQQTKGYDLRAKPYEKIKSKL